MDLSLSDFDFHLPENLIAQSPAPRPEDAKLLIVRLAPKAGEPQFENSYVGELPSILESNTDLKKSLWVRNRSAVFKARIYARRPSGGRHEIVFLEPLDSKETQWKCLIRGSSHFKLPQSLTEEKTGFQLTVVGPNEISVENARALFDQAGEMPLPPYIRERNAERDEKRYQPEWADEHMKLSAAAPTASLHFSPELIKKLTFLDWADLYLHVGLGTFEPLRNEKLNDNKLHCEKYFVPAETLSKLSKAKAITAVGTTALRCLESLDSSFRGSFNETVETLHGSTEIFIKPGFEFKWVQNLWTNFHLPQSSLFVLISAFAGSKVLAKEAYEFAIKHNYRFFSYGDASIWIR